MWCYWLLLCLYLSLEKVHAIRSSGAGFVLLRWRGLQATTRAEHQLRVPCHVAAMLESRPPGEPEHAAMLVDALRACTTIRLGIILNTGAQGHSSARARAPPYGRYTTKLNHDTQPATEGTTCSMNQH